MKRTHSLQTTTIRVTVHLALPPPFSLTLNHASLPYYKPCTQTLHPLITHSLKTASSTRAHLPCLTLSFCCQLYILSFSPGRSTQPTVIHHYMSRRMQGHFPGMPHQTDRQTKDHQVKSDKLRTPFINNNNKQHHRTILTLEHRTQHCLSLQPPRKLKSLSTLLLKKKRSKECKQRPGCQSEGSICSKSNPQPPSIATSTQGTQHIQ